MNEIVRTHYPVSRLPDDLRGNLPKEALVEVRIIQEEVPAQRLIGLADLVGTGNNVHGKENEVLAWIREGREDREP